MWQQLCFPDSRAGVDTSSHDVPASSLEPRTVLPTMSVSVAVGGYSATAASDPEESFFLTGPPRHTSAATGALSRAVTPSAMCE